MNAFALALFLACDSRTPKGNKFISPVSAWMALSMAAQGASGETQEAMLRTLGPALKIGFPLEVANSLWANAKCPLKPEYVQRLQRDWDAHAGQIESAKQINSWVSEKTHGRIEKLLEKVSPEDLLILINTVWFKAEWQVPFSAQSTHPRPFHLANGATKNVPTMALQSQWRHLANGAFEAIELPYKSGASMIVILPARFSEQQDWEGVARALRQQKPALGVLRMPKLHFEASSKLNQPLEKIGMARAFTDAAQFSGMSEFPLKISEVLQSAFLSVDEVGTEAAAATSVTMMAGAAPRKPPEMFTMNVDRPYLFAIRDDASGALLFLGSIAEPEL